MALSPQTKLRVTNDKVTRLALEGYSGIDQRIYDEEYRQKLGVERGEIQKRVRELEKSGGRSYKEFIDKNRATKSRISRSGKVNKDSQTVTRAEQRKTYNPNSKKVKDTTVYIVSDSPEDQGRTFDGQKILSPQEYHKLKRTSSNIQKREPNNLEKEKIQEQIIKEEKTDEKKILEISSDKGINDLNKKIEASVSSELRERQRNSQFSRQETVSSPLEIENPNQRADKWVFGTVKQILKLPGAIVSGAKKKFITQPKEINNEFVDSDFASQYGNYQQIVFGEQTPSSDVLKVKQDFDTRKRQIERKYSEDKEVKTFENAATIATVAYGGTILAGVKGANLVATAARGAGNVINTGVNAAGVAYAAETGTEFVKNPTPENLGDAIIGGAAGVTGAGGLKTTIGNQAARIGAKEVSAESVFNKQVLEGKQTFPTTKSARETYQKFKKTDKGDGAEVIHATPSRGSFGKEVEVQAGPMGALNKEDAILFTTPKGEGSSHFLGVSGQRGYSLNPLAAWRSSKPAAIEVKATGGVKTIPGEIIQTAKGKDFAKVNEFLTGKADKTAVYPTARSTLKQTSELEGGITAGSKLVSDFAKSKNPIKRSRGYDEYVVIDGKTVPIKKYRTIEQPKVPEGSKIIENANVKAIKERTKNVIDLRKYEKDSSRALKNTNKNYIGPRAVPGSYRGDNALTQPSSLISSNSKTRGESSVTSPVYGSPKRSVSYRPPSSSRGGSSSVISSPGYSPGRGSSSGGSSSGGSSSGGGSSTGRGGSSSSGGGSSGGSSHSKPPGPPPSVPKVLSSSNGFKPKSQAGYDIFIREKGKRIKTNDQPIPYNLALKQGKNIVDNTIAASFELQKRGTTNLLDIPSQIIGDKFRARRTKNALKVVEKSKNRIDTPGEKQELNVAKFMKRFKL